MHSDHRVVAAVTAVVLGSALPAVAQPMPIATVATSPLRAVLTAATHTPKVRVHWPYSVQVSEGGPITRAGFDPTGISTIGEGLESGGSWKEYLAQG